METQRVALSLPSEARTHVAQAPPIKWGDLDLDDEIASADGAGVDITINYKNSSSHFADQRAASLQNDDATRGKAQLFATGKEGSHQLRSPPHEDQARSPHSPRSPARNARRAQPKRAPPESPSPGFWSGGRKQVFGHFGDFARSTPPYKASSLYYERADQRNGQAPQLNDETRLAIARSNYAQAEVQLRIENQRAATAQIQLQVQMEKTATAKAQLAVEKTRRQIRQLDIELELKQADSAAAKSTAAANRDAARLLDLDKQMALAEVRKAATELQLDVQNKRALTDLDVQMQQAEVARAYIGLQQARLRNKQDTQVQSAVDADLVHLGVLPPRPEPK
jgi:hypothetical protein